MISDKHRCIFIRVPKTASQSIAQVIEAPFRTHTTARRFRSEYPVEFESYYKFAFVRNPWDRLSSAFSYIRSGGCCKDDLKKKRSWVDPVNGSFERFVEEILPRGFSGLYNPNVLVPQLYWIEIDGDIGIDFVGRYESLERDWMQISKKLELSCALPSVNTRGDEGNRLHYTDRMKEIVAEVYRCDIEIFGYEFEKVVDSRSATLPTNDLRRHRP